MGSIALLRQTPLNGQWYAVRQHWEAQHAGAPRAEPNRALVALQPMLGGRHVAVFVTRDELDYARALAVAQEMKLRVVLLGNGHEYREAERLRNAGVGVIVPLRMPEAPAVEDPAHALDIGLEALQHWRMAPYNARLLSEAGVPVAFTTLGLDQPEREFWPALRKQMAQGLDENAALAALILQPARMLGIDAQLGSLAPGKRAHLLIADADLLRNAQASIHEVWIDGQRYPLHTAEAARRGRWALDWQGARGPAEVEISGQERLEAKAGAHVIALRSQGAGQLWYVPSAALERSETQIVFAVNSVEKDIEGRATLPDGHSVNFHGRLLAAAAPTVLATQTKPLLPSMGPTFPAGEHGRRGLPYSPGCCCYAARRDAVDADRARSPCAG